MTTKAIGYVRVSTEGQAQEGVSLEAQRAKIEAWCELNDYTLASVHVDAGISGKSADNRPGLQQALNECRKGTALIVYSLSRLARSTKDTLSISERLSKAGADLVSLSEKIDTTSAAGKMVFRMLAVLAEFERDQISERTSAAMQHMKTQGKRVGHIPFGSCLAADGIHLEQDPDERSALEIIGTLQQQGLSLRAIAAELNARGILNRGNPWNHVSVSRICKNAA